MLGKGQVGFLINYCILQVAADIGFVETHV